MLCMYVGLCMHVCSVHCIHVIQSDGLRTVIAISVVDSFTHIVTVTLAGPELNVRSQRTRV